MMTMVMLGRLWCGGDDGSGYDIVGMVVMRCDEDGGVVGGFDRGGGDGVAAAAAGGGGKTARAGASGVDGRVDRVTRKLFEAHRKTPPEKFFGGGDVVAGGGGWPEKMTGGGGVPEYLREKEGVYKCVMLANNLKVFSMLNAPWSTCDQKFQVGIVSPDRSIHNTSAYNSGHDM
ncbi:hypothetical protein Tco_1546827, partial [Tanacetum coccineum]